MANDFDILIIGGGMVGSCVAALAGSDSELRDARIALLEARPIELAPGDDVDLRVSALSRASQRILESVGAWSGLPSQHLSKYTDMVVWDARGKPAGDAALRFSASETHEAELGHIVENRRVQWALCDTAVYRQRVTQLTGQLSGLEIGDKAATVTLADGRRITAGLVVGADGAQSVSRRLVGIETRGWDYEQRAFVTHMRTELPHRCTAWQRFLPEGPIAFLPLADGRSSLVWSTTPTHAEKLMSATDEALGAELSAAIDHVLGRVEACGPRGQFPLRLIHARDYCRSRFVLVGDAAHAVHPLAGQGVNLGFMDCAALVQTLADARAAGVSLDGLAELRVLRRYERWRKSENVVALGLIDGLNRVFSTANPLLGWARRSGLTAVDQTPPLKRFFMGRAMGTAGELPRVAMPRR